MPNPKDFKDKVSFIEVCVPEVIAEGKPRDQAVAQCMSMWESRDKTQKSADLAGNFVYEEEE